MPLYRYTGDPDDDNAAPPVVAGRTLKIGDATADESVNGDRRFVRVADPDAEAPAKPVPKKPAGPKAVK